MAEKFISMKNLKFLLYDAFDAVSLTNYPYYQDHSREIFDMVLDTAVKIGKDLLRPCFEEMDKTPPALVDGEVKVHPSVKAFMRECGEGGWIAAGFPSDAGGQQLPRMITIACRFIFSAANFSASVYPSLTTGAARLIYSFGSDELKRTYLPKMIAGEWQGTMALTEPQAGSSLADVAALAVPSEAGFYKIRGQKLFISASDHDGVENVVHLMLARIKGAPAGLKGLSLFVVPKMRIDEEGRLAPNDVKVAALYHKLGYRGAPITQLSMGEEEDCRGFLVGAPNRGLSYMFQMMNEARLGVGMAAAAIASAAYYASLEYSKERLQGRSLSSKEPGLPQVPLVEHPDVKRMLLFQRAVVEGSLSLLLQCCKYADLSHVLTGREKEKYALLLDLLTPVAKSYPSEMGILSVSQGLQCLGGYGYCDEFPLEQHWRDARIHPIHEGTTGIQALDLLGRKIVMKEGKAFEYFMGEVKESIAAAEKIDSLRVRAGRLAEALETLRRTTTHLLSLADEDGPEVFLADAALYLELFGIVAVAWQWLVQAVALERSGVGGPEGGEDNFYKGKTYACRYFFEYELPKIEGLARRLCNSDGLTVQMRPEYFSD